MLSRKMPRVGVALALLLGPLVAVAQPAPDSTVTTAPLWPAPAVGIPLLALLVIVLAVLGAYLLRRAAPGVIAKVVVVAALTALAGSGLAREIQISVTGSDCVRKAVFPFTSGTGYNLISDCPISIQILSIDIPCGLPYLPPNPCQVGQVLGQGESCNLPRCPV
jgi:hypothetical protein